MTEQERNLLRGCLKGEKSAWDPLVHQYSGLVYYTIKKTLGLYHVEPRADIVEDLFQDFFLSLMRDDFRKLRQFRAERGSSGVCTTPTDISSIRSYADRDKNCDSKFEMSVKFQ